MLAVATPIYQSINQRARDSTKLTFATWILLLPLKVVNMSATGKPAGIAYYGTPEPLGCMNQGVRPDLL